jgi:hypothetical protein
VRGIFGSDAADGLRFTPPTLESYLPVLLDYADRARWGKRVLPRWSATAPLAA